jgi:hypothetical protein
MLQREPVAADVSLLFLVADLHVLGRSTPGIPAACARSRFFQWRLRKAAKERALYQ